LTCDILHDLLIAQHNGVNLKHIESRPSKQTYGDYDFFVDCCCSNLEGLQKTIDDLRAVCKSIAIMSRNVDMTVVGEDTGE